MAARYKLCGEIYEFDGPEDADRLEDILRTHYNDFRAVRPLCLCRDEGVLQLYIARIGDKHVLKRWPDSGSRHHHSCDKYEAPPEASGAGALANAIIEDPATGLTSLKIGFALKKLNKPPIDAGGAKPLDERADEPSKKVEERKLSLKSMLHYFWEKTEFNRWQPAMKGKRSWRVIHKYVSDVASTTLVQGKPLSENFYIPRLWTQEEGRVEEANRRAKIGTFITRSGPKRILLLMGEVKSIEPAQFGYQLVLKSMSDTKIYLSEDVWKAIQKRFEFEVGSWREDQERLHLVTLLQVTVSTAGACNVQDLAFMLTNREWLPVLNFHDGLMVSWAVETRRVFLKPLPYNLGRGRTVASIILVDTKPLAVNVFVTQPDESEVLQESRQALIAQSKGRSVIWRHTDALDMDDLLSSLPSGQQVA